MRAVHPIVVAGTIHCTLALLVPKVAGRMLSRASNLLLNPLVIFRDYVFRCIAPFKHRLLSCTPDREHVSSDCIQYPAVGVMRSAPDAITNDVCN